MSASLGMACHSLSLTCIFYTIVLTFAHFSRFTHIYNDNTSTHYHLAWEFEKWFFISFITLRFIQPKINELFMSYAHHLNIVWVTFDIFSGLGDLAEGIANEIFPEIWCLKKELPSQCDELSELHDLRPSTQVDAQGVTVALLSY